jgi:hypothetical protein
MQENDRQGIVALNIAPKPLSTPVSYSLNTSASVQLTEHGKKLYYEHKKKYNAVRLVDPWFNEKTSVLTTELWYIMHIFGKELYNGCEVPFVNNTLTILDPH